MREDYSGKQVNKAGEILLVSDTIKDEEKLSQAMAVMSFWRFSHEEHLEIALSTVQRIAQKIDKNAIFAKRLKRYPSILLKLQRFEKMKLKNMQDIGGCRAIVSSEKKLRKIVRELKKFQNSRMRREQFG